MLAWPGRRGRWPSEKRFLRERGQPASKLTSELIKLLKQKYIAGYRPGPRGARAHGSTVTGTG